MSSRYVRVEQLDPGDVIQQGRYHAQVAQVDTDDMSLDGTVRVTTVDGVTTSYQWDAAVWRLDLKGEA